MELKTARLTLLIDPNKKVAFERLCARQDRTASQVVRQLIRDYLAEHGVADVTGSATAEDGRHGAPEISRAAGKPAKKPGPKPGVKAASSATRAAVRRR